MHAIVSHPRWNVAGDQNLKWGAGGVFCVYQKIPAIEHMFWAAVITVLTKSSSPQETEMIFHWVRFLKIPGLSSLVILVIHGNLS